jgi:hypothetical protein
MRTGIRLETSWWANLRTNSERTATRRCRRQKITVLTKDLTVYAKQYYETKARRAIFKKYSKQ